MEESKKPPPSDARDPVLDVSHRLEYFVILTLVIAVGIITIIALVRLFFGIYDVAIVSWDLNDYHSVQVLFGMVMSVLIALEFGNSILRHIRERSTIIQAREVVLIGMMAVVRKVMIVDLSSTSPASLAALALAAIALAGAFWLMRESS